MKWTDSADGNPDPNTMTVIDWACNDTPDASILAGRVPEPSTTALLLLAGTGTALMQRRRQRQAA